MDCLSPILEFVSNRSRDLFSLLFGHVLSLEQKIYSLRREIYELQCVRCDVQREVDAAERQGLTCTNQVRWWLESADALRGEAAAISMEFEELLIRGFGDCPLNVFSRYHLAKRAAVKLAEVRDLKSRAIFSRVADGQVVGQIEEVFVATPIGMGNMLELLHEYVRGSEVDIVGIQGMGGSGKSSLLRAFNNELLRAEHDLDIVIFLEVTSDLNIEKIQRTIGNRLGLLGQDGWKLGEFASCIHTYLIARKFVLLLDDMWEPLDLPSIGIPAPNGQHRRKIILATRIEEACTCMGVHRMMKVECLPWPESWALFAHTTGKDFTSCHPEVEIYARAIARRCGGLPLALTTVGRALAGKETVKEWRHALMTLISHPWQLSGMKERVLDRLKLSYDHLASHELRRCFLYCSLFPEFLPIEKERVSDYWLCEGFLSGIGHFLHASDEGDRIIGVLKAASLLEPAEVKCDIRVHPMTRSLALWVASDCGRRVNRWLVQTEMMLNRAPEVRMWHEAERISLMCNEIYVLPDSPLCPDLLTLMLSDNKALCGLPSSFFLFMPSLRVLDLSFTSLEELPAAVGMLRELRYLNLWRTKLVSLPRELGFLAKLLYLEMSHTPTLRFIPKGVIAGLAPRLRLLGMFDTRIDWEVSSSSGHGVSLEELEGMEVQGKLAISIGNVAALQRLCSSHHLASSTIHLHIYGCEGMATVLLPSAIGRSTRDLCILQISDSTVLREVIFGGDDTGQCSLGNLQVLKIRNLRVGRIVCREPLPQHALGRLQELWIDDCPVIEQLMDGVTFAFAWVQELHLLDLPMLSSIGSEMSTLFPSLKLLYVHRCPRLRKLPLGSASENYQLISIMGQREWWDGLEWEDNFIKSSFQNLFQEIG